VKRRISKNYFSINFNELKNSKSMFILQKFLTQIKIKILICVKRRTSKNYFSINFNE
jgi:mitochondrial fission protein ELM1